jgi:hypothetical protein
MAISQTPDTWVYVVVVNPGGHEQYFGIADDERGSFIPVFLTKEDAQAGLLDMPRKKNNTYEVQAVLLDELQKDASASGFNLCFLDSQGRLLDKIPSPPE